jgi:2Fe-2S ferredoxin
LIKLSVKDYKGEEHQLQGLEGDTLMEVLREYEWGVAAICGGLMACGTCQVYLDKEWQDKFPPIDPEEQDLLDEFDSTNGNSRLSCQLRLDKSHDGLSLTIAPDE